MTRSPISPRALLTALLAAAALLLAAAPAAAQDERAAVEGLLQPYDVAPGPDAFKRAAADPVAQLIQIAEDPAARPRLRVAALYALGLHPEARTRAALLRALDAHKGAPTGSRTLHAAITALALAFGDDALDALKPLLTHPDVQVRLTLIHALARHGGPDTAALLRAHAEGEKDPVIVTEIEHLARALR